MADTTLIQRLRDGGILLPEMTIAEARRSGLKLALACALLEKESSGGRNVFGHDPNTIFAGAGDVTKTKYLDYRRRRVASGNRTMQGVGPCQLTWWELQDEADREGGCWKPEVNMRVGFRRLAALIDAHGAADGARRYNGSGEAAVAYSKDLAARAQAWEARLDGLALPGAPRLLRRGDEGRSVEQLTRRLAYVRRRGSAEKYLRDTRERFDGDVDAAVRAFQRDHRLTADGVVGSRTALALNRAVRREKARRQQDATAKPAAAKAAPARLPALVERVARLDAESDEAWAALAAHGRRRVRLLAHVRERQVPSGRAGDDGSDELASILLRIEAKLGQLVEVEQRAMALEPAPVEGVGATEVVAEAAIVPFGERAVEGAPPRRPRGDGAVQPLRPPRGLGDLSDAELLQRIERLDEALGMARGVLIRRYAAAEAELSRLGVKPRPAARVPQRKPPAKGLPRTGTAAKQPRLPRAHAEAPVDRPARPQRDRDERLTIQPGHVSWRIRQSKVALARYLKRHRRATTGSLRRKLLTEARTPKVARRASPAWGRAVREAQAIAKLPVTGELDERLATVLAPLWPSDATMRRIVRSTPAWRMLPGQITPNFALREFGCHDGTSYVEGLMREQGLTKRNAKERARQLAERLERLRVREGNRPLRPNSVFRTKAYNASVGGVVGSAHTRGYAADLPAPAGVTLARHREHVRAVFEGGVGYYPTKRFVHGDFDPNERGDSWTG